MISKAQTEKKSVRIPNTPEQDVEYHIGMSTFMAERGYPELSRSHAIVARDIASSYLVGAR